MPKVTKRVHYRRFDPTQGGWAKGTLQSLLANALGHKLASGLTVNDDWSARTLPVPGEPQLKRFAHNISVASTDIAGTMCLFSPNDWAPVLIREGTGSAHKSLDEALREVEIAERPPLDGEDYLRGVAYWLVVGDHLFVVQHTSIQTKAFEEYFKMLFDMTGVTTESETFGLKAVFNKTVVGGDLDEIMAVEVGGILSHGLPEIISTEAKIVEEQETIGRTTSRFEKALDVLKAVFGEPDAERILRDIPEEAELEVDVRFGYKTRRRGVSRAALADIARSARNLPDGEVTAFGRDGKQIGDDLRLSLPMPFELLREHGALLDLEDARTQLMRVYQRFIEDGKIE
ncbi:hypothetical protein ACJMQP_23370 [Rhodopseudomonas palustris]